MMTAISVGFVLSSLLFSFLRIMNARFPLDIVSPFILMAPSLGYAVGPLWPVKWREQRAATWLSAAFVLMFVATTLFGSRISLHFLASTNYYPYPKPTGVPVQWLLLGSSLLLSVPVCLRLGTRGVAGTNRVGWLFGVALGLSASYCAILVVGASWVFALSAALTLMASRRRLLTLAVLALSLGLVPLSERRPSALLTWRVGPHEVLETTWSPYYFLNFISFRDGHCLGGVYSYLMLWQVCDDTSMLQKEQRAFHRAVGKGKTSLLVLGRTDGTTPLTLESDPGQLQRVTAVEIDPIVVDRMKGRYRGYNQGVFERPGYRAVVADWRNFIERDRERYDLIVMDGLGIRLVVQPLTNFFQEDFVFTRESFRTLFDERLEKDGILAINWGSSVEFEAIPLVANFPDDVGYRIFWTTFSDYPFMGLPVFLIAASRDESALARIADELRSSAALREVHPPYDRKEYRFTDDTPFLQRFIQPNLLLVLLPLPLFVLGAIAFAARRSAGPSRRDALVAGLWGFLGGWVVTLVAAWCSRLVSTYGPYPGGLYVGIALIAGMISGVLSRRLGAGGSSSIPLAALASAAALMVALAQKSPLVMLVSTAVLGLGLGMLWPDEAEGRGKADARLAFLLGLYAAQGTPFFIGYRASGWAAAVLIGVLGAIAARGIRAGDPPILPV